jgi:hypothetical protein
MQMRTHVALSLLLVTAPAQAEPILLPCNLPMDQNLRLIHVQESWSAAGAPVTVRLERQVRITRQAAGLRLQSAAPRVQSSLTGAAARRLANTYATAAPLDLGLGADGSVSGIEDQAIHWKALMTRIANPAGPSSSLRAKAMQDRLAGFDGASQRQLLAGFWLPFVRLCGQFVPDGHLATDKVLKVERQDEPSIPGITAVTSYQVDPANGLAHDILRIVTPQARPDQPLRERWSISFSSP